MYQASTTSSSISDLAELKEVCSDVFNNFSDWECTADTVSKLWNSLMNLVSWCVCPRSLTSSEDYKEVESRLAIQRLLWDCVVSVHQIVNHPNQKLTQDEIQDRALTLLELSDRISVLEWKLKLHLSDNPIKWENAWKRAT